MYIGYSYEGVFGPFNTSHPGAIADSAVWKVKDCFYMFGGISPLGFLGELWAYNYTSDQWAFMGNRTTAYGTMGIPSATNWPPERHGGSAWIVNDVAYMYGGHSIITTCTAYYISNTYIIIDFNDLWIWNNTLWTWIGGSSVSSSADATYADYSKWSSENYPMAASNMLHWTDNDNLWLYGGRGVYQSLGDLWVYNTHLGKWAWLLSNVTVPAKRYGAGTALVNSTLVLYGGYDTVNTSTSYVLSDMWRLNFTRFNITGKYNLILFLMN